MYSHDDECACFPCFGIRLRKTDILSFPLEQGFNNNPDIDNLPSFGEIIRKSEEDKKFSNLWNSIYKA